MVMQLSCDLTFQLLLLNDVRESHSIYVVMCSMVMSAYLTLALIQTGVIHMSTCDACLFIYLLCIFSTEGVAPLATHRDAPDWIIDVWVNRVTFNFL